MDDVTDLGDLDETARCGLCGGPLMLLGGLGRYDYCRCRNCGCDQYRERTPNQESEHDTRHEN